MKHIFIKLNTPLCGKPVGTILRVPCDANGTSTNVFWRRRIADSVNDNCVEVLKRVPKNGFVNA